MTEISTIAKHSGYVNSVSNKGFEREESLALFQDFSSYIVIGRFVKLLLMLNCKVFPKLWL